MGGVLQIQYERMYTVQVLKGKQWLLSYSGGSYREEPVHCGLEEKTFVPPAISILPEMGAWIGDAYLIPLFHHSVQPKWRA